jgi:hypothetical protein
VSSREFEIWNRRHQTAAAAAAGLMHVQVAITSTRRAFSHPPPPHRPSPLLHFPAAGFVSVPPLHQKSPLCSATPCTGSPLSRREFRGCLCAMQTRLRPPSPPPCEMRTSSAEQFRTRTRCSRPALVRHFPAARWPPRTPPCTPYKHLPADQCRTRTRRPAASFVTAVR